MNQYAIVSLRWTSPKDDVITFYSHKSNGYSWDKRRVGIYAQSQDGYDIKNVEWSKIKDRFVPALLGDRLLEVLPKAQENRKIIGIKKKNLLRVNKGDKGMNLWNPLSQPRVKALDHAVSALYFSDGSDYKSALWGVVKRLAPNWFDENEEEELRNLYKLLNPDNDKARNTSNNQIRKR